MDYSLTQPHVFDYLKNGQTLADGSVISGRDWFKNAIADACNEIASTYACEVNLASRRLEEAQDLWVDDVKRMRIDGDGTPDHFKQAGFLCFWLRRRIILAVNHPAPQTDNPSERQSFFIRHGNEVCAFLIAFKLCAFYQAPGQSGVDRVKFLQSIRPDPNFLHDVAVLLFHKNVSPHALYLILRALFNPIYTRPPDADPTVIPIR